MPFKINEIYFLIVVFCIALYLLVTGLRRVRPVGQRVTDFTIYLIRDGYSQSSQEDKDAFFQMLQDRGLIVRDGAGAWKVTEGS